MILISLDFAKFIDARMVIANDASGVKREGIFIPFLQNGFFISKSGHPWLGAAALRMRQPFSEKHKYGVYLRAGYDTVEEMMSQNVVNLKNTEKTGIPIEHCILPEPIGFVFPKIESDGRIL